MIWLAQCADGYFAIAAHVVAVMGSRRNKDRISPFWAKLFAWAG
jgi:hypothetical protein